MSNPLEGAKKLPTTMTDVHIPLPPKIEENILKM